MAQAMSAGDEGGKVGGYGDGGMIAVCEVPCQADVPTTEKWASMPLEVVDVWKAIGATKLS